MTLANDIAVEVMGLHKNRNAYFNSGGEFFCIVENWDPETNAIHMMLVVERMREAGYECQMVTGNRPNEWFCSFWLGNLTIYESCANNLGTAVCEAALKAVRARNE